MEGKHDSLNFQASTRTTSALEGFNMSRVVVEMTAANKSMHTMVTKMYIKHSILPEYAFDTRRRVPPLAHFLLPSLAQGDLSCSVICS